MSSASLPTKLVSSARRLLGFSWPSGAGLDSGSAGRAGSGFAGRAGLGGGSSSARRISRCSAASSGDGCTPSCSTSRRLVCSYTSSAAPRWPDCRSARISLAARVSRMGYAMTRPSSSATSDAGGPARSSASTRCSRVISRSSSSRAIAARPKSVSATSASAGPRHSASASRSVAAAAAGSSSSCARPAAASSSNRTTSVHRGSSRSWYPVGRDSIAASGTARRSRDTRACSAFAAPAGVSSAHSPSMSWPEVTSRPGCSASMISRARSLAPPTSTTVPSAGSGPVRTSSGPSIATCTASILPDAPQAATSARPARPAATQNRWRCWEDRSSARDFGARDKYRSARGFLGCCDMVRGRGT